MSAKRGAAIAALLLLAHICYFFPYVPDDTFISLRYAQRLVEGKGLSWNDGEFVEGYSNLLWVLLAAALHCLGFDLLQAVQGLGIACVLLTLWVFVRYAQRHALPSAALCVALLFFALTAPVAIWAAAGLEVPMVMLLYAIVLAQARNLLDRPSTALLLRSGLCLGLMCALRPEGPVYGVAVALGLLAAGTQPVALRLRQISIMGIVAFACFAALLVWRLNYYGEWVPNTVLAKVALSRMRLASGFVYVGQAIMSVVPALWCAGYFRRAYAPAIHAPVVRFLLVVAAMISLAVMLAGGDWLLGYRAMVPLVPALVLLLLEVLAPARFTTREKALLLASLLVFAVIQLVIRDNLNARMGRNWTHEVLRPIGEALKEKYGQAQPLLAVFTAGAVPYYSGLPTLDMYGLSDSYLTHHRHANAAFGQGLVGHDLFDADYVISRKPQLLLLEVPGITSQCANKALDCQYLKKGYHEVVLETPRHRISLWERDDSSDLTAPARVP